MSLNKATIGIVLMAYVCGFIISMLFILTIASKFGILSIQREVTISIKTEAYASELYSILNVGKETKNMEKFGKIYAGHMDNTLWKSTKDVLDKLHKAEYEFFVEGTIFKVGTANRITKLEAEVPVPGAGGSGKLKGKVVLGI